MKVSIKNLGLLDEANFEIADFTVICGKNNTGKTYASYAVYGFLKSLKSTLINESLIYKILITNADIKNKININKNSFSVNFDNLREILKYLQNNLSLVYKKDKLYQALGGRKEQFENADFSVNVSFYDIDKIKQIVLSTPILDAEIKDNEFIFNSSSKKNIDFAYVSVILSLFIDTYRQTNIISVERTGAAMFMNELNLTKNAIFDTIANVADMIKNKKDPLDGNQIFSIRRYPEPVEDNLNFVQDFEFISKQTSFLSENVEIKDLLWQIIGGKYIVENTGIKFAAGAKQKVMKNNKVIDLQLASSSVKSLMLLNFYILYLAQKNDILIIDEPELNLHPANQILVARLLVLLVNVGIKVLITTHSDYIVREISNCIMLKNLDDKSISDLGYSKSLQLRQDKIKAYLAENKNRRNIFSNVKITQENGIFMETFNEVIKDQDKMQDRIYEKVLECLNDK